MLFTMGPHVGDTLDFSYPVVEERSRGGVYWVKNDSVRRDSPKNSYPTF